MSNRFNSCWLSFFIVTCLAFFLPQLVSADLSNNDVVERIALLRHEARYAEAKTLQEVHVEQTEGRFREPTYRLGDAIRLLETLELASRLPTLQQQRLAEADRLEPVIEKLLYQEKFVEAFASAVRQLEIRHELLGPNHCETLQTQYALGLVLYRSHRYLRAEEQLRHTIRLQEKTLGEDHPAIAQTLIVMARTLRLLHPREQAQVYLTSARPLAMRAIGHDSLIVAQLLHAEGTFSRGRRPNDEVIELYRQAHAIRCKFLGADHPESIGTLVWMAHVVDDAGNLLESERLLQQAYDLTKKSNVQDLGIHHITCQALARHVERRGDAKAAEELYLEAIRLRERQRFSSPSWFGIQRILSGVYGFYAHLLVESGRHQEAWESVVRGSGWLTETLRSMRSESSASNTVLAELDSLKRGVLRAESRLTACSSEMPKDYSFEELDHFSAIQLECLRAETSLMLTETRIAKSKLQKIDINASAIQAGLQPTEAIVGWMVFHDLVGLKNGSGSSSVWGYIIRKSGNVNWIRIKTSTRLSEWKKWWQPIDDMLSAISSAASWPERVYRDVDLEALAQESGNRWFAPLKPHLDGVDKLIVNWDVLRFGLPLECLRMDDGSSLVDQYAIKYVPFSCWIGKSDSMSTRDLSPSPRTALMIGDPHYGGDSVPAKTPYSNPWTVLNSPKSEALRTTLVRSVLEGDSPLSVLPRLPMSNYEVERIGSMFPQAMVLVGRDASEERIEALAESGRLRKFEVVHVASHALFHPRNPERSALALSPSSYEVLDVSGDEMPGYDGLITAREIQLGWSLQAELVTLSGCQTGRGPGSLSDGPIGFHQAFFAAGAQNLLTSLWKVDDVATALLMQRFYENFLERRLSSSQALRQAKIWLRDCTNNEGSRPFEHPSYWAGFVLMGN